MIAIEENEAKYQSEFNLRTKDVIFAEDIAKSIIMVFCDYCQCRQPFDLIRGGQMICIECRHNVNTVMRKAPKPEDPKIYADILGFDH